MWGERPWDNDQAADWLGGLMEKTSLPDKVRHTLRLANKGPDEETTPLLRAAAWCLIQLGHIYVWPVSELEDDLKLAIHALELVLQDEEYCYNEAIITKIKEEQKTLQERLDLICNKAS
ncbi:hypothetical protein SAMN05518672_11531 [Chitinophaga sp. CF118]|uniref:hypothetical protein n=1 Tax=Chitinophaga sp. CF118 TaxID=1884367 RepID=UPI0008F363D7|nr:hypothetical protein [Chitinophaga sp. CF118]SFF06442.1 hypothetical protein SAMN05518672_11531 [Chitinophaga sp. CF118]